MEALETRRLLDAEGVPWPAPDLTISFAPDGTPVAGYESTLFQSLDAFGDSSVWQDAIVRGFDTWAQFTAASVSTTADSGDAFGTPGPTQGDPRFGDVRVAAIPMANDIIAMSVPHDEVISGTWAGDILFNSNADLNSIDEIFAIAVHEAGHVVGLGHSTDPNSPMYLHGITSVVTPTAADINSLQRLYGVPQAEESPGGADAGPTESEHEREHSDDELFTANSVMLSANFQGAIRYDATGQIFDATDVDFYQLAPIDDQFEQADVLTVTVRATTPDGLIPSVSILDQEGQIVESTVLANANGEFILQAKGADPRQVHFVEVKASDASDAFATGTYDLTATFRTRAVVLDRIAKGTLKPDEPMTAAVLHVSETRLVHFVLAADPVETSTGSIAWTVIYDASGSPVFRAATRPGESRSANTLLLTPGNYRIEFHTQTPTGTHPVEIDFRLSARSISLPVGPDPIDTTTVAILPCSDPVSDPVYCYPDEVAIIDPFILPAPTLITLPDPLVLITPPWLDPALWYWDGVSPPIDLPAPIGTKPPITTGPSKPTPTLPPATPPGPGNSGGGGNPSDPTPPIGSWRNVTLPEDVNADSQVSPLDALLVINFLNASGPQLLSSAHPSGSPFLDVNSDGFASPVDALLVFNELNRLNGIAAEGEAVIDVSGLPQVAQARMHDVVPASSTQSSTQQLVSLVPASISPVNPPRSLPSASLGTVHTAAKRASVKSINQQQSSFTSLEDAIAQIAIERTIWPRSS